MKGPDFACWLVRTVLLGCCFGTISGTVWQMVDSPFGTSPMVRAEETSGTPRPYSHGPLKISEFEGAVPVPEKRVFEGVEMDVYVKTAIRFRFNYGLKPTRTGLRVTLTEFEAFAVFLPGQSWYAGEKQANPEKSRPSLLHYAQGHFDLAEIWARRATRTIREENAESALFATGATREDAERKLLETLEHRLLPIYSSLDREREYYGEETGFGKSAAQLARARGQQRKTLQKLTTD